MPVRPRRDFQGLERRRKEAARLFAAGKLILASIARQLKVSRQSVTRWYREWQGGGAAALRGARRAGRKPKLNPRQPRQVDRALRQGARAHGFDTDLWTLPRAAQVVERVTGVRHHPGHIWKILGAMDWSLQRPVKQARERDEQKVKVWLEQRWPAVKKTLGAARPGSSSKTRVASPSGPQAGDLGAFVFGDHALKLHQQLIFWRGPRRAFRKINSTPQRDSSSLSKYLIGVLSAQPVR